MTIKLENLPFGIDWEKIAPTKLQSISGGSKFICIFGRCEGFTYYLKRDQDDGGSHEQKHDALH